jgi:PAS domain S-box-containing protein
MAVDTAFSDSDLLTLTVTRLDESFTENARVAAALRASERQHRELFERTPLPMFAYDRDSLQIIAVSDAATATYGYSREELLAMTINDIVPAEDVPVFLGHLDGTRGPQRLGDTLQRRWRHQYKNGKVIDVEIHSDDLTLGGRDCRIAVCQDVTERNVVAAELARVRAEAESRSKLRSRLLSNLSHEVCTPMNGVLGMNEALLLTDMTREQRGYAEQIANSATAMLTIIHELLDIAQIETGHVQLDVSDFGLHETIEQACAIVRLEAVAKRLDLDLVIDPQVPPHMCGDARRLRKVLVHLLSNAVKFTDEGAIEVHVSVRRERGAAMLVVEVSDSGIGIDTAVLESMFSPFVQTDSSMTRQYQGAGLGLAIARAFTELMGGAIGATSQTGVGSTFRLQIPFERLDTGQPAPTGEVVALGARSRRSGPHARALKSVPGNRVIPTPVVA